MNATLAERGTEPYPRPPIQHQPTQRAMGEV